MMLQRRAEQEALWRRVRQAAEALKSYFGARRVVLFGSLVDGEDFGEGSDIDLAVEGIEAFDHWQAWWFSEEIVEDRPVDLVPVEGAEEALLRAIEQHGVEI
jgi:predicted nucleotidyltransferase